jgi:hypothetical protein
MSYQNSHENYREFISAYFNTINEQHTPLTTKQRRDLYCGLATHPEYFSNMPRFNVIRNGERLAIKTAPLVKGKAA